MSSETELLRKMPNNGKIKSANGTAEVFGESWIVTAWKPRSDASQELHESVNSPETISWLYAE